MSTGGWIGFDLDGTIAQYDDFVSAEHIGKPIPATMALLRNHLERGVEVRIFTARIWPYPILRSEIELFGPLSEEPKLKRATAEAMLAAKAIWKWLADQGLPKLALTTCKDYSMWKLYDDRAVQVEKNTGVILGRDY